MTDSLAYLTWIERKVIARIPSHDVAPATSAGTACCGLSGRRR